MQNEAQSEEADDEAAGPSREAKGNKIIINLSR